MVMALIAVVLVAVAAVVAKLTWRPRSDEDVSVRRYHSALGTMEAISERTGGSGVRVLGTTDDASGEDVRPRPGGRTTAVRPPTPPRIEAPEAAGELVFDDGDATGGRSAANEAAAFGADLARRRALTRFEEPRRGRAVVVVIVVVAVVFAALAYVGSRHVNRSSSHRAGTVTTAATRGRAAAGTTTTSTTTPSPAGVVASSSTDTTAVYPVGSATYQVTVTATTEPSWIDATSPESGATIWTGTVPTGGSQTIPGSGPMVVELGALAGLSVNGVPVVFPTPAHSPFTATFEPTSGTSTTSGASGAASTQIPTATTAPPPTTTSPTTGSSTTTSTAP